MYNEKSYQQNKIMKKVITIKERLILFIDYKDISVREFCRKINYSATNFAPKKITGGLGSDILMNIVTNYPEINLDWLITGRGEMINTVIYNNVIQDNNIVEEAKAEFLNYKEKYYEVLERYYEVTKELDLLKKATEPTEKNNVILVEDTVGS